MHSPGLHPDLAGFLADERPGVRAVGLDTASLDFGPSTDFAFHVAWLPTGRYGIENLARLDELPPKGARLFVGAPKLQAGSGGRRGSSPCSTNPAVGAAGRRRARQARPACGAARPAAPPAR